MGITWDIAAFSSGVRPDRLPPAVMSRARLLLLDFIGNIVCARHDAESTPSLVTATRALGLAAGNSTVFGDTMGYTPAGAALLNGALGHSLEFDDTHTAGSMHPGCTVIPAALAAGEIHGASGADVLAGIVAGYDVACRIALALPAADHFARGFQPTSTCGVFGAAAAAARVFGLDPAGIESALGIALSQSAGSPQYVANGAWTKRFQVGWAAMSGLAAACLAREGFRGAIEALEGKHGFLQRSPSANPARVVRALATEFELMNTAVKPYPCCRFGHAGIDAALAFRTETAIDPTQIERVTYGTSEVGMDLIGAPATKRQNPRTVVDGQFSGPFMIAAALATGHMNWDSYALLHDPVVRTLLPRIISMVDGQVQAEFPDNMSGKLTIVAGGRTWQRMVRVPKGEPSTFLTDAELRAKFTALTSPCLGQVRANQLADAVLALNNEVTLAGLTRLAAPATSTRLAGE